MRCKAMRCDAMRRQSAEMMGRRAGGPAPARTLAAASVVDTTGADRMRRAASVCEWGYICLVSDTPGSCGHVCCCCCRCRCRCCGCCGCCCDTHATAGASASVVPQRSAAHAMRALSVIRTTQNTLREECSRCCGPSTTAYCSARAHCQRPP
jgi:hypothetical protein